MDITELVSQLPIRVKISGSGVVSRGGKPVPPDEKEEAKKIEGK